MTRAVPRPGSHGGDGAAIAAALGFAPDEVLDLSASMNPVAPDTVAVVARHLGALRRYPDAGPATAALAAAIGVDRSQVLLTNGGSEAISLVVAELGGWVEEPEFSLHPRGSGPRWRSNPHNPTGRLALPSETADVWDEAFYPLATGRWTRGDGVVVVGSLTKLFDCPGLRAGYVLGPPELIEGARARQPEWSVNGLVASALPELLELADLEEWASAIAERRGELLRALDAHGLEPQPSDANFVLCRRASGLRERLAMHGVVVRDCTSFGLPGYARVAVPDWPGLERLLRALAAVAS